MGPRRWSRGRGATVVNITAHATHGFNGATAMEPWKRTARLPDLAGWRIASMGPRRWSRGRVRPLLVAEPGVRLQWGHGDGAVEERALPVSRDTSTLQWGHGDGAVEEGPPPGPFGAMDLRPGLREGRSRGYQTDRELGVEVTKSQRNRAWARREARARAISN